MEIRDINFLKQITMERKLDLLKFKKATGGSVADDEMIQECDRIIQLLEKEEEKLLSKNKQ